MNRAFAIILPTCVTLLLSVSLACARPRQAVALIDTASDRFSTATLASPIAARLARLTSTRLTGDDYMHLNEWQLTGPPVSDTTPPNATVNEPIYVYLPGGTSQFIHVNYSDSVGLDVSSFNTGDLMVTGPNGFNAAPGFYGVDHHIDGSPRTVAYWFIPPGGFWDSGDNGSYLITLQTNQVRDTLGNSHSREQTLCSFSVSVPPPVRHPAHDLAEYYYDNAELWLAGGELATASTEEDYNRRIFGANSIHWVTDGAYDTWLRFPPTGGADWDLTMAENLSFSLYAQTFNNFGFQENSPWVRLYDVNGGYFEYRCYQDGSLAVPLNSAIGIWRSFVIPLRAPDNIATGWRRMVSGSPRLDHIGSVEFHADTIGQGFELWIDKVNFGPSLLCPTCPVAGWGDNYWGQVTIPSDLSNIMAIATAGHSLVLTAEGRVMGWGNNWAGQSDIPSGLSNVVAIAAGNAHTLALTAEGRVIAWGWNVEGQTNVPGRLTNAVAIAAGGLHNLALTANGQVVGWGCNTWGQATAPNGLSNVVAIAAGESHSLALTAEGRVVGWGANSCERTSIPRGLSKVRAIAAGGLHSLALTAEGRVVGWGDNSSGQATVPSGLSNVVAIAAGYDFSLALTAEGRVVGWGNEEFGQLAMPPALSNVVAIAAGGRSALALVGNGSVTMTVHPTSRSVCTGATVPLHVMALGTGRLIYQWQFNGANLPGASNASLVLPRVQLSHAGSYSVIVSNTLGAKVSRQAVLTVADCPPDCLADSDDDGMPDGWEHNHGLDPFDPEDATQDPDRDGMNNLEECIAGTHPCDPHSVLRLSCTMANGCLDLSFVAVGGRKYEVQYCDAVGYSWETLAEMPAATNAVRLVRATDSINRPMRIYRVVLP